MSNLSFLSQVGCFVVEKFLTAEQCEQLRAEALSSDFVPALKVSDDNSVSVDDAFRKTKDIKISNATRNALYKQMLALKPEIEEYFSVKLEDCQAPQALIYHEGDFFKVHRDVNRHVANPIIADRQVSIVIFLNEQSPEPREGCFCGGSLNLYGLINQPGWSDKAFPIAGQVGLLIAFRSDLLHEVTEVICGERFTVVNWFF